MNGNILPNTTCALTVSFVLILNFFGLFLMEQNTPVRVFRSMQVREFTLKLRARQNMPCLSGMN